MPVVIPTENPAYRQFWYLGPGGPGLAQYNYDRALWWGTYHPDIIPPDLKPYWDKYQAQLAAEAAAAAAQAPPPAPINTTQLLPGVPGTTGPPLATQPSSGGGGLFGGGFLGDVLGGIGGDLLTGIPGITDVVQGQTPGTNYAEVLNLPPPPTPAPEDVITGLPISDTVQGQAPGTGILQDAGVSDSTLAGMQFVNQALNPGIRGYLGIKGIVNDPSTWAQNIDYAIDVPRYDTDWNNPLKRSGMVNWGFRKPIGQNQPEWAKEDVIAPIGSIISNYLGPGYAAGFQGLYSKTLDEPYDAGFKRAGIAAGASWLSGELGKGISGMMGGSAPVESSGLAESGADIGMDLEGWSAPESWGTPETISGETVPVEDLYSQPPMDMPNAIGTPRTPLEYGSDAFFQAAAELGMDEEQALNLWDTSLGGTSAYGDVAKDFLLNQGSRYAMKKGIPYAAGLLQQNMLKGIQGFTPKEATQIKPKWAGSLMTSPQFTQEAAKATKMQPSQTRWEGVTPELPVPDKPVGMEKAEKKKRVESILGSKLLSPIEEEKLRTYLYDYLA